MLSRAGRTFHFRITEVCDLCRGFITHCQRTTVSGWTMSKAALQVDSPKKAQTVTHIDLPVGHALKGTTRLVVRGR